MSKSTAVPVTAAALTTPNSQAEEWATRINIQRGRSVEAIIETGRLFQQAKDELEHGEWGRMFKEKLVPVSQATADQYMAVARHPILSNSEHAQILPASWSTLYRLARLSDVVGAKRPSR
jgi:hypothetical protein